MSTADVASRLGTHLRTVNGAYDEVVAISQGVVNKSFAELAKLYPDSMGKMHWEQPGSVTIDAELYPSTILLPGNTGSNLSKIYYQIRFKTGTLKTADGEIDEKLDNWIIAVQCDLEKQDIADDPKDDRRTRERKKKQREFIQQHFAIPGDYTVQRLYAKLTDAYWSDFVYSQSYFGLDPDGHERNWEDFTDDIGDENTVTFKNILSTWAESQEKKGLTLLGVQLTLPPTTQLDPLKPTYAPTSMRHQIYPYLDEKGLPSTGFGGKADANSILYCEMVTGNPMPKGVQLDPVGNFCYPAVPNGAPGLDGTFALNHDIFIKRFLLPSLQPLNQISVIRPYDTEFSAPNSWTITYNQPLDISFDRDHPSIWDQVYEFHVDSETKPTEYRFTKSSPNRSRFKNPHADSWYAGDDSSSITNVTVRWESGKALLRIAGATDYLYDHVSSSNEDLSNPWTALRYTFTVRWNFDIDVTTSENGVLEMKLSGYPATGNPANLKVENTRFEKGDFTFIPADMIQRIETKMSSGIGSHLVKLRENLEKAFKSSGRFIYPGNGQLDFKNPMFNNNGDLLSEIHYKPIKQVQVPNAPQAFKAYKQGKADKVVINAQVVSKEKPKEEEEGEEPDSSGGTGEPDSTGGTGEPETASLSMRMAATSLSKSAMPISGHAASFMAGHPKPAARQPASFFGILPPEPESEEESDEES